MINIEKIDWSKGDGLVAAIVQDERDNSVLMLGFMNAEALQLTLSTQRVTFYSRSRQRLWTKGETSGNILKLKDLRLDCDGDALLLTVEPQGPTCHTGSDTCWGQRRPSQRFLDQLDSLIEQRYRERPEKSYSTSLFEAGALRMAQKVGEEGVEVALAAQYPDDQALLGESADLVYHLLILLRSRGLGLKDLEALLEARHLKA